MKGNQNTVLPGDCIGFYCELCRHLFEVAPGDWMRAEQHVLNRHPDVVEGEGEQ